MKEYSIVHYCRLFHAGNKSSFARAINVAPQNINTYFKDKQYSMIVDSDSHRLVSTRKTIKLQVMKMTTYKDIGLLVLLNQRLERLERDIVGIAWNYGVNSPEHVMYQKDIVDVKEQIKRVKAK